MRVTQCFLSDFPKVAVEPSDISRQIEMLRRIVRLVYLKGILHNLD